LPRGCPSPTDLYLRAGECALALDKSERAVDFYASALSLSPENLKALRMCAQLLQASGDLSLAYQTCEHLSRLEERGPNKLRAQTLHRLGAKGKAPACRRGLKPEGFQEIFTRARGLLLEHAF